MSLTSTNMYIHMLGNMNFHGSLIGNLRRVQGRFLTTCETSREPLTLLNHSFSLIKWENGT